MWMLSTSLGDRSHRPTLTVARSCPRRLTSNVGIPNQAQSDQFRSCNPAARFDTCATLEYECTGQIGLLEKEVFFQHSLIYFTCIHAPRTTVYTKSHPFYIFWVLSPISPHLQCQSTRTLHMDLHMTRRMERINGSTREEEANSSTKKCKGPKNKNPRAMLKSNQKRHPASLSLMASITLLLLANLLILPSCKLSGSCFFRFFFAVFVFGFVLVCLLFCFGHIAAWMRDLTLFFHPDEQKRPTLPQWRARHWSTNRRWESEKRPTETQFAIVRRILQRIFFHLVLDLIPWA